MADYIRVKRQRLLTVKKTAARLGISEDTLHVWRQRGLINPHPDLSGMPVRFEEAHVEGVRLRLEQISDSCDNTQLLHNQRHGATILAAEPVH